jgi:hypothetical protein
MRYTLTSVNVRYHVKNDSIRQGEGSSVNSKIKDVNKLRHKLRVIMEQTGRSFQTVLYAEKLNGTCTRLYRS